MSAILITDIGSVDPDDVFALLCMIKMFPSISGIVATHHYVDKRVKLIKLLLHELGMDHVPVYTGEGIIYSDKYDDALCNKFIKENNKFPTNIFGAPKGVAKDGELVWFPNFMQGYYDVYGEDIIESYKSDGNGNTFLINALSEHSPDNKLLVLCIAPPA